MHKRPGSVRGCHRIRSGARHQEETLMQSRVYDPAKRHQTRHRGVRYRERADGARTYLVYFDGKWVKAGTTEREAVAKQAELRSRKARGERAILPTKVTFGEVAEQWLESKHRLRAWTKRGYRDALDNVLLPRFGTWRIASIDADAIAKLIRDLEKKGYAASTITNYCKPLSGTLGFAVRRGLIASNPYRSLTSDDWPQQTDRRLAHEWTDEEISGLLAASAELAARRESHYDYTPLLRTAIYTGLRLGELLGLQWRDVDFEGEVLHVRRQFTLTRELTEPKTKNGLRRVPLSADMSLLLRRHKIASVFSQDTDFVFASKAGTPLGHRNVQRRGFELARVNAGLPDSLTFHDLRHAFASLAAHRGVPVQVLSAALGHGDIGVTQRIYIHLYGREQAEEAFRMAMAES